MHLWPVYQDHFISDTVIDEHCHVALWVSMRYVNHIMYKILDVKIFICETHLAAAEDIQDSSAIFFCIWTQY